MLVRVKLLQSVPERLGRGQRGSKQSGVFKDGQDIFSSILRIRSRFVCIESVFH